MFEDFGVQLPCRRGLARECRHLPLDTGGPGVSGNCPPKDTKRQERRARRILPYEESMGPVGKAVKLRK